MMDGPPSDPTDCPWLAAPEPSRLGFYPGIDKNKSTVKKKTAITKKKIINDQSLIIR